MSVSVLTRRHGKKNTSVYQCRKGSHQFIDVGGFESYSFRWCTTCGCLEETANDGKDAKVKIRMPDTGI